MSDQETTLDGSECDNESDDLDTDYGNYEHAPVEEYLSKLTDLRNQPLELSETISLIECENGTKVYIVGTAHFSEESIADVRKVIGLKKPDIVVLELCKNRTSILSLEKENTKKRLEDISLMKMVKELGAGQGLLQYILNRLNAYLINELDMLPGGEFKAALEEVRKQPHYHVLLGDRSVSVTLYRALASLGLWERIKFAYILLFSLGPITKDEIEALKKTDLVEKIIREVAGDHPGLIEVLVDERDRYLTKSIYEATGMVDYTQRQRLLQEHTPLEFSYKAETAADSDSSSLTVTTELVTHRRGDHGPIPDSVEDTAVALPTARPDQTLPSCCNDWPSPSRLPRVVVAVVGFGHVAGIRRLWPIAEQIDRTELVKLSEPPLSWKMFKWSLRGLLIAVAVGSGYGLLIGGYRLSRTLVHYVF